MREPITKKKVKGTTGLPRVICVDEEGERRIACTGVVSLYDRLGCVARMSSRDAHDFRHDQTHEGQHGDPHQGFRGLGFRGLGFRVASMGWHLANL